MKPLLEILGIRKSSKTSRSPSRSVTGDGPATENLPESARLPLDAVFPLSSQKIVHTYVSRPQVEKTVRDSLRHGNSIIQFSGPSKSGKTVLVSRLSGPLPQAHLHVWRTMTSDEFWDSLRAAIEAPTTVEFISSQTHGSEVGTATGGKIAAGLGGIGAETNSEENRKTTDSIGQTRRESLSIPGRIGVIEYLKRHPHTIVIDDYHWINPDLVPDIFPPLKQALGLGSKVILISVSKSAFPATGDMGDFSGRVISIEMPPWTHEEIQEIAEMGFGKLNLAVPRTTIGYLDSCSYFSPLLMQGLCNRYCYEDGVTETCEPARKMPELTKPQIGELAARFAKPLTTGFDTILANMGEKKWPTKDRDGRLLSMTEVLILGISHTRPFEPISLDTVVNRLRQRVLHGGQLPAANLPGIIAKKARELQTKLGGEKCDRSPLFYDQELKTITIVDPYFKLWVRWVHGSELGGNLFPD